VACASFDWVEFILRREIEASDADKSWLNQVRGRDRRELWDPNNQPPGYAPANVRPTVYNETLEFAVTTTFMRAPNP